MAGFSMPLRTQEYVIMHMNLQATQGVGTTSPVTVFCISHFLHLEYNFDVLDSCWGYICTHLDV